MCSLGRYDVSTPLPRRALTVRSHMPWESRRPCWQMAAPMQQTDFSKVFLAVSSSVMAAKAMASSAVRLTA